METYIDIETIPCADRQSFIDDARANFKAPSGLTKEQAGKDLGLVGDALKYASKDTVIAQWEAAMASTKADEVGYQNWRKTALDGTKGRVLSIAHKVGTKRNVVIGTDTEETLTIKAFFQCLEEDCGARPPYFVGHNVTFDLKFLFRRAAILGIRPPFELPFKGRHGSDFFCTSQAWCAHGEYISLDNLASALGLGGKGDFDGSMVCDAWLAGEYEKIRDYNMADVELTEKIHKLLTFRSAA
jgi:3'-5' exonuclease